SAVGKEDLEYIEPTIVDVKPVVHVQSDQFAHIRDKYAKLVVGCFVGRRPAYSYVKEVVARTWKLKNTFTMKVYGDKMFTFEFSNEDDRKAVLDIGSFHVASQLFVVRPWKLFVEAETEELKTIPIWVLFKKLPIELWDRKGFSQVGSAIGRPLFADKPTEDRSITSYARRCIEVDLKCKYPNHVDVVVDQKK
ncbi:hypothetical protein FRX31_022922, partial [Thalictrum thalictroides]